jgi:hypothetical protein
MKGIYTIAQKKRHPNLDITRPKRLELRFAADELASFIRHRCEPVWRVSGELAGTFKPPQKLGNQKRISNYDHS